MKRRIASHYALINGKLERNAVITVEQDGTILSIEQPEVLDSCASVEFFPGIITAGMINAHCHLELSYLAGAIAEGQGFAGFAREIGRVRGNYSNEERIHAADIADALMWEEGVQAVADIANDALVMDIKRRSKIEYITLFEHFGLNNNSTDAIFALAAEHSANVTPHSTYSVQDRPFREICNRGEGVISIHFLESKAERELYSGGGSLAEWYARMGWECDFLHHGTPAKRIAESVPSDRKTLIVHCVECLPEDVEVIDSHINGGATWVVCPESNRYISGTTPPIKMLRDMGCRIAIGTDSRASARHLSMIENLRLLGDMPLEELLSWATIDGAKALGMEHKLGSIEVGKCPGLVLIEGVDLQNMRLTEESKSRRLL
ncbi:MAG: amidohydrolase family protein [Alistipes sp.]|nr:amidohydrolase family protein [Alistipes sp.]